ncbi:glycine zipper 2TM domain-containing protein [Paludibacterium yongneupense]|uniref:glycine zipper 2TM domain-containing protein n=1 Tax=Paludibacterium yongneupense TaxID=400061 RepID=UPI00040031B7|nr:glycine zipper 2TM domain-containing protein [Paludibacterium yongneupense]
MQKRNTLAFVAIAAVATLSGCAATDSATGYSRGQMQQAQSVQLGTILSIQNVKTTGDSNDLLTLGGAAVGGIAGSNIGQGKGAAVGAILGALAGGVGANAAQHGLGSKMALEITVKLDSGRMISIVQDPDVPLAVNQRVRVLSGRGADRVVPF